MKMRLKQLLLSLVAVTIIGVSGVGCKDKIHESIHNLVDDFIDLIDQRADILCDCYKELDYDSRVDCLQDNQVRDAVRTCVKQIMVDNETTAREHLECVRNAEAAYNLCLEDHECGDSEALAACLDYFHDDEDACPYLPEDVAVAADECWSLED
jgi:hypothetical protein